jgi:hypothetical protein
MSSDSQCGSHKSDSRITGIATVLGDPTFSHCRDYCSHPYSSHALAALVEPQPPKLVETAPTGPKWVHEVKFEGYRMAARIDPRPIEMRRRVRLRLPISAPEIAPNSEFLVSQTMTTDSYDELVRFLNGLNDGPLDGEVALLLSKLLAVSWESFDGNSESSMAAHKIEGRAHGFKWKSPILTFEIDRHGGTVLGSTRADRQEWTIDLEKRTARPITIGYSQLSRRASPFKAGPVIDRFVNVISR